MTQLDTRAEMFASRVYEMANKALLKKMPEQKLILNGNRKMIETAVRNAVKNLDLTKTYQRDGGRMVEYVTDSLCSLYGFEE